MLVVIGTVAFESKHFVSIAVTSKKGQAGAYYPALNIKLTDKEMQVASDDGQQIKKMYIDALQQLGVLSFSRQKDPVVINAEHEVDKLLDEIYSLNLVLEQKQKESTDSQK